MTVDTVYYSLVADRDASEDQIPAGARTRSGGLARSLLSKMLLALWDIPPADLRISTNPSGKPFLEPLGGRCPPFISLTHTRGWVACAVSGTGPLGVDIEWHRPGRNHAGIARAAFGPLEQQRAGEDRLAFYRIWTLREAIAKATGEGLTLATDRRDRVESGPEEGNWRVVLDGTCWLLSHHRLQGNLNLAIATILRDPSQTVAIQRWHPMDLTSGPMQASPVR